MATAGAASRAADFKLRHYPKKVRCFNFHFDALASLNWIRINSRDEIQCRHYKLQLEFLAVSSSFSQTGTLTARFLGYGTRSIKISNIFQKDIQLIRPPPSARPQESSANLVILIL
jgi:hypothetical protein